MLPFILVLVFSMDGCFFSNSGSSIVLVLDCIYTHIVVITVLLGLRPASDFFVVIRTEMVSLDQISLLILS